MIFGINLQNLNVKPLLQIACYVDTHWPAHRGLISFEIHVKGGNSYSDDAGQTNRKSAVSISVFQKRKNAIVHH